MKLNSKQKLYVSVLGVSAFAFLADKAILGPRDARADLPAAVAVTVVAQPLGASEAVENYDSADSARAVIADRLAAVAKRPEFASAEVADAFRPAESWLPAPKQVARPVVDAGSAGDRFRQVHQLNAVMAGQTSFAMVDGRTLLVGQEIDGFVLISVSETTALFESEKGRVELTLPVADR